MVSLKFYTDFVGSEYWGCFIKSILLLLVVVELKQKSYFHWMFWMIYKCTSYISTDNVLGVWVHFLNGVIISWLSDCS